MMTAIAGICAFLSIMGVITCAIPAEDISRRARVAVLAFALSSWLWVPWAVAFIKWNSIQAGVYSEPLPALEKTK